MGLLLHAVVSNPTGLTRERPCMNLAPAVFGLGAILRMTRLLSPHPSPTTTSHLHLSHFTPLPFPPGSQSSRPNSSLLCRTHPSISSLHLLDPEIELCSLQPFDCAFPTLEAAAHLPTTQQLNHLRQFLSSMPTSADYPSYAPSTSSSSRTMIAMPTPSYVSTQLPSKLKSILKLGGKMPPRDTYDQDDNKTISSLQESRKSVSADRQNPFSITPIPQQRTDWKELAHKTFG